MERRTISPRERGTALIMTLIVVVALMGLAGALFTLTDSIARDADFNTEQLQALTVAEAGMTETLRMIQTQNWVKSGSNWDGFVEENGLVGADYTYVTGSINNFTYRSKVRSIKLALASGGVDASYYTTTFEDDLVDVYEITTTVQAIGKHAVSRSIQVIVEIRGDPDVYDASDVVPLYVHEDPQPDLGGQFHVSGRDHIVGSPTGANPAQEECSVCGGDGHDPTCSSCGGSGTYVRGKKTFSCGCTCPNCGGGGAVDTTGQPDEEDYLVDQADAKPARAALATPDLDFSDIKFNGAHAPGNVYTDVVTDEETNETTTVNAEDAYTNITLDLRSLAAQFVGGDASAETLSPTRDTSDGVFKYYDMDSSSVNFNGNPYDDPAFGDTDDMKVTYIKGDSGTLASHVTGSGVLIVEGDVHLSGRMSFTGLVIVLGELHMTGGGNTPSQIRGAIMAENTARCTGNADIWWCNQILEEVFDKLADPNGGGGGTTMKIETVEKCWREMVPDLDEIPAAGS